MNLPERVDSETDVEHHEWVVSLGRGYFAVPGECTLTELADVLGIDTSTASETIRRGTARVVEQFLVN